MQHAEGRSRHTCGAPENSLREIDDAHCAENDAEPDARQRVGAPDQDPALSASTAAEAANSVSAVRIGQTKTFKESGRQQHNLQLFESTWRMTSFLSRCRSRSLRYFLVRGTRTWRSQIPVEVVMGEISIWVAPESDAVGMGVLKRGSDAVLEKLDRKSSTRASKRLLRISRRYWLASRRRVDSS